MSTFKILSLDGGGSRGIYSLGVLFELEKALGSPLVNHFDAFYGTSTGAIISTSISLGRTVEELRDLYLKNIPDIMGRWFATRRSTRLAALLKDQFGDKKFDVFQKPTGVVVASLDELKPKIFKSHVTTAHGRKPSFLPGFGLTIREAVQASCAAYPIFSPVNIKGDTFSYRLVDGGFSANNPALFGVIDANAALGHALPDIKVLSVGTGTFPEKLPVRAKISCWQFFTSKQFISDMLALNSSSLDVVRNLLVKDIQMVRVSEVFAEPSLQTSLMECDVEKLKRLYERGRVSFGNKENEIMSLLTGSIASVVNQG
jgi:patatin-like phospholipase/acyl hydrolase